jgi:hypothetical protein
VLDLLGSRRFEDWYAEGGSFDKWVRGADNAPTDLDITQELAGLLGLPTDANEDHPSATKSLVTKTQIRELLKEKFAYGAITQTLERNKRNKKAFLKSNGKLIHGIYASGHGPLDVTQLANERVTETFNRVCRSMEKLGLATVSKQRDCVHLVANPGNRNQVQVYLSVKRYPTYPLSSRMDPGYETSWVVVRIV